MSIIKLKSICIWIAIIIATANITLAKESGMCQMLDETLNKKINTYLNNIKKVAVEFEQTDSHSSSAKGMLIIDKPHKFRCNYYAPFPLLIIGNKNYVSVYDYEMEHFARIKAEDNIFNFLLLDNAELKDQFQIMEQKEHADTYEMELFHEGLERTSNIFFDKKTGNINKIIIHEDDNVITLTFSQTRVLSQVAKELFIIKDPDIFGKPKRLEKKELEKLIN